MWNMKEFRDDNPSKDIGCWRSAKMKLLDFLNEVDPEVTSFSAYGTHGEKYKLVYKEREVHD